MLAVIHINTTQPHQVEHALWWKQGLRKHGIALQVTPDVNMAADLHIVSGPHYAKERWLDHSHTILLDRALYHEERSGQWHSMDWVSLGWLNPDGGRLFHVGEGRTPPQREPGNGMEGSIFLADFDGPVDQADTIRLHPAKQAHHESLDDALDRHGHAIGYMTSALTLAALKGLSFECRDERSIMAQENWLELLPYADWHNEEIASGEAWEHLSYGR